MPSTKVTTATAVAALGEILVYALHAAGGPELPPAIEQAIVVLLTFVLAYAVPEVNPSPSAIRTTHERGLKE